MERRGQCKGVRQGQDAANQVKYFVQNRQHQDPHSKLHSAPLAAGIANGMILVINEF